MNLKQTSLLSLREVALRIGKPESKVVRMIEQKLFPDPIRVAGMVKWADVDVQQWIDAQQDQPKLVTSDVDWKPLMTAQDTGRLKSLTMDAPEISLTYQKPSTKTRASVMMRFSRYICNAVPFTDKGRIQFYHADGICRIVASEHGYHSVYYPNEFNRKNKGYMVTKFTLTPELSRFFFGEQTPIENYIVSGEAIEIEKGAVSFLVKGTLGHG